MFGSWTNESAREKKYTKYNKFGADRGAKSACEKKINWVIISILIVVVIKYIIFMLKV